MEVKGYKCFYKGLSTQYGDKLELGKVYTAHGKIVFGKNGYHFCQRMEDTFRYFDTFNCEVDVAKVIGMGKIDTSYDDYNEYYDLYCSEKIMLLKLLTRDDIIRYGLNLFGPRAWRFISTFGLTKEEIKLFKEKYYNEYDMLKRISVYQEKCDSKIKRLKR